MEEKGKQGEEDKKKASEDQIKGAIPKKLLRDVIKEKRVATKKGPKEDKEAVVLDPYKKTNDLKDVFRKPTAYGYVQSREHYSPFDSEHPESYRRCIEINEGLHAVYARLHQVGVYELINTDDDSLLNYAHPLGYIEFVKKVICKEDPEGAIVFDSIFYNNENTYRCAVQAARMTTSMAKSIAEGKYQNGFANIRPPGHHATTKTPGGYCFFNNVAIAANYLLKHNLAEKILIVDYDVHHGQATQQMFYKSNKVLYFSIHRYEHGTYWPNLAESDYNFIGEGEGKGFNINVPLNETGLTDYDYMSIVLNVLMPIAYEFQPSIVLVSAGFDAVFGDPEGRMNVTPAFYGHITTMLCGLAEGKLLTVLEGGYFIPGLKEAALRTVRALLNDPCSRLEYSRHINPSVIKSINDVKNVLRPYWKCINQYDDMIPVGDISRSDPHGLNVPHKKFMGVVETPPFALKDCYPKNTSKQEQMFVAQLDYLKEGRYDMSLTNVGYLINPESIHHDPPVNQRAQEVHSRIVHIMEKIKDFNLLNHLIKIKFDHGPDDHIHPENWSQIWEEMTSTHRASYVSGLGPEMQSKKPDLYWTKGSKETCHWSVAILCQLGIDIGRGFIRHGIGIIRPPGHHAKYAHGSGFCLVNNVVIAASYLIREKIFKKVLIIDFDVHHGDGTQALTYHRNDIMYISMHRFDDAKFFPKDKSGDYTYVGEGKGRGYNINIPFNTDKMDSVDWLQTWIKIVLPISYAFEPDIILVSAGFDAAVNDPLGNYNLFPEVYGHFIQLLKPIGPIIIALEGGYNPESTSLGMVNCARALLGQPLPMPPMGDAKGTTWNTILDVLSVARVYWPILEVNKWVDARVHRKFEEKEKEKEKKEREKREKEKQWGEELLKVQKLAYK